MRKIHHFINNPVRVTYDGNSGVPRGLGYFQYTKTDLSRVNQAFYIEQKSSLTKRQVLYHENQLMKELEKLPDFLYW